MAYSVSIVFHFKIMYCILLFSGYLNSSLVASGLPSLNKISNSNSNSNLGSQTITFFWFNTFATNCWFLDMFHMRGGQLDHHLQEQIANILNVPLSYKRIKVK